ncbi:kinase-like domain-containing protein [Crassisporium funariophilum]|nr:kinase-like domain-containing protein [Crassisporium funariophilum]
MLEISGAIGACLDMVPVPGLRSSFLAFKMIWDTIQAIQALKEQLLHLTRTIAQLLETLDRELRNGRMVEGDSTRELANLQSLLSEISQFVEVQASYGILKVIYKQQESTQLIEHFHQRIATTIQAFNITALLDLQEWQIKNASARTQDQDSLNTRLSALESNQNQLAKSLNDQHSSVMAMMISLQKSLNKHANSSINARQRQFLSHSLNYLASTSREHATMQIDGWSITSFEVEFGSVIGSGGFGQVHKGTWNKTPVALKVLRADEYAIPSSASVRREIEAWVNLRHPHVLQFLGANVFDDKPFIVMPYLKNGNARDYLQSNPNCDRVRILHHSALGLLYLHSQGVIHGDLKALNILIDNAENALLCDFGLSRVKADATSRSVRPGAATSVAGSRNWMSPERILGGTLRKPVDIYAFGMTIYEIFTGEIPLGHLAYADYINLVVHHDVRPERPEEEDSAELTDEVWDVAVRCWQKDVKARPDAASLCDEMERCVMLPKHVFATSPAIEKQVVAKRPLPPFPHKEDKAGSSSTDLDLTRVAPNPPTKKAPLSLVRPALPKSSSSSNRADLQGFTNKWSGSTVVNSPADYSTSSTFQFAKRAKVLFDYTPSPEDPNELPLRKGEVIHVLDNSEKWWIARKSDGKQGIVPCNYVDLLTKGLSEPNLDEGKRRWNNWSSTKGSQSQPQQQLNSQPPTPHASKARTRHAYTAPADQTHELSFSKGEVLEILNKQENWWIARNANRAEGIVPSNYMQII